MILSVDEIVRCICNMTAEELIPLTGLIRSRLVDGDPPTSAGVPAVPVPSPVSSDGKNVVDFEKP